MPIVLLYIGASYIFFRFLVCATIDTDILPDEHGENWPFFFWLTRSEHVFMYRFVLNFRYAKNDIPKSVQIKIHAYLFSLFAFLVGVLIAILTS